MHDYSKILVTLLKHYHLGTKYTNFENHIVLFGLSEYFVCVCVCVCVCVFYNRSLEQTAEMKRD
jgi:hypothetical protein